MRRAGKIFVGILAVVGAAVIGCGVAFFIAGIDARQTPSQAETRVARALRHTAIPGSARKRPNSVAGTPEVLKEAMAHFADHCASCHGNDGKGQTEIGKSLYPRAPDMTAPETQQLSDGELFFIIKNGVRFTGMPAWGKDTAEDDADSWKLVHFIRQLPKVTQAELSEMEVMNPVSPMELKEREEEARFLEGKAESPSARRPPAGHKH